VTALNEYLKTLISAPGLSGHEGPIRELIRARWAPLVDELHTSRMGSLHGLRRGSGPEPRPRLLLAAHMDAIGLMTTAVVEGLLRVVEIGGIDARVLPGQLVTIHGKQDYPGVIAQPPAHLLPASLRDGPVPLDHLWVDSGLTAAEAARQIPVGSLVSFAQPPVEMAGELLAGHSLDNRASVAAVTQCLEELKGRPLAWDLWVVASVQEEVTLGGAATSAYELDPTLAVAIDVTHGSGPGAANHNTFPFAKGLALGWGPNVHPGFYGAVKDLADRLEIPYKMEPMPRHSGTDSMAMQIARAGIPNMVVSIPLRYMHTPVEMVSLKDVARAGRLLAEFASLLDDTFMDRLKWDES
jgi:endoglucanase